jgi:hypothetical protein
VVAVTLPALRDDALASAPDGFVVRLSLPWIRSLPLASVEAVDVTIDGEQAEGLSIALGDRLIPASTLSEQSGWWFLQDRLVLRGGRMLRRGAHDVSVSFRLLIPYLQVGPDGPLTLPFRIDRSLVLDAPGTPSISRDVD